MSDVKRGRYVAPFEGVFDTDGVQVTSGQDKFGREVPDPVPLAPPVGYRPPPTLADMIRRMVQSELLTQAADLEDFDSFEEAEDFDIEDDPLDPKTPYEAVFDPPVAARGGAPGGGGDVPPPPNTPPTKSSPVTNGGPNVKRSEGDEPELNKRTAADPSPTGAHHSERAPTANSGGNS